MHRFTTPTPPQLDIEFRAGDITIVATDEVAESTVELTGHRDDDDTRALIAATLIEQRGDEVVVQVPKDGGAFGRTPELRLRITAPRGSRLAVRSGSGDLRVHGSLGASRVDSGSGDVRIDRVDGTSRVRAGSGDVVIDDVGADLEAQTGSGDIRIGRLGGSAKLQSGSGDVHVDAADDGVHLQTGSGDISLGDAGHDVKAQTGSGDVRLAAVRRGRVLVQGASGDIHVGVTDGTAAWLDVTTLAGRIESDLESADAPADGEERVHLKLNTVSGDITVVRS
ncbi:MAG: DUF4097 domain-containing protein [Actinomycetota bacterium]|nr:DUF4097 domain-containing protein [Actinomycetota bacterium]